MYNNGSELLEKCRDLKKSIAELVILDEIKNTETTRVEIIDNLKTILEVMQHSIAYCVTHDTPTMGGIIGGEAKKLNTYLTHSKPLSGTLISKAMVGAFACSQYNASMGKVCAAPTAGSSGILPATLITVGEEYQLSEQTILNGLLTAGGIGKIITQNATVSGAEGGCQAECGSAAAMAAAAIVAMLGGSPETSLTAASIALKNIMGLICDPIGGLVESPCSKRNASGVANAIVSAEMALAGIQSVIPFDEVVESMYHVGINMPTRFRETAEGGIAITPTALKLVQNLYSK